MYGLRTSATARTSPAFGGDKDTKRIQEDILRAMNMNADSTYKELSQASASAPGRPVNEHGIPNHANNTLVGAVRHCDILFLLAQELPISSCPLNKLTRWQHDSLRFTLFPGDSLNLKAPEMAVESLSGT